MDTKKEPTRLFLAVEKAVERYREIQNKEREAMFRASAIDVNDKQKNKLDDEEQYDIENSMEYDPGSRPESGIASGSADESSDDDREDGQIFFRYDEEYLMEQRRQMQDGLEQDGN